MTVMLEKDKSFLHSVALRFFRLRLLAELQIALVALEERVALFSSVPDGSARLLKLSIHNIMFKHEPCFYVHVYWRLTK